MYYYKLYGMGVRSDFQLVQLLTLSEEEWKAMSQITIREKPFPDEYKRQRECYSQIDRSRSILSNSYCYLFIENGETICYEKKEKATDELLNAFILGWGMAILFYQRGQLAIHCSCVEKDGRAILISGNSGSGKSTITAELLKRGYSLMADDMVVVTFAEDGKVLAAAAFPYQKLCRDALGASGVSEEELIYIDEGKDKFLVPYKGVFIEEMVPVQAMYVLACLQNGEVNARELVGGDKFHACMQSLFLKPLLGEGLYAPENGAIVLDLASRIPVYEVERPVGKDTREEVLKLIWEKL